MMKALVHVQQMYSAYLEYMGANRAQYYVYYDTGKSYCNGGRSSARYIRLCQSISGQTEPEKGYWYQEYPLPMFKFFLFGYID